MKEKLAYVLKNFQLYYDIGGLHITYGDEKEGKILITRSAQELFFSNKQDINPDEIIWKEWKGRRIPFLFDEDDNSEIITVEDGFVRINYDIIASSFYFLSGWNEYLNPQKDQYGRVVYQHSMINKLNTNKIPVVNYYFDILYSAILKINGDIKKNIWGNNGFGVALTHDIDICRSAWRGGSLSEFKKRRFLSIPKLILKRFFGKDDWFNFKLISKIDKQYAASSTFYFLPQKGKTGIWENADYDITSKSIRKEISKLEAASHEIGVHGSFGTHTDIKKFEVDISRINASDIEGNRFHFLMYDAAKSVQVLEDGKMNYDSSLAFAEEIGFRRGTCYPFYLYNFVENRISHVIEIPLMVMDGTLENSKYMGLLPERSFEKVKPIIEEVIKFGGVFTILWHNNYFSDYMYTGWKDVYIEILRYCKNQNGFLSSAKEIYEKIEAKEV